MNEKGSGSPQRRESMESRSHRSPPINEETEDWRLSRAYGFWLPSAQLEQKLRHEIKIEQRASYDEFRKWATLSFAVAGFLLAFYSVRAAKQPDPCPRNYYRSDSGECVFAQSR